MTNLALNLLLTSSLMGIMTYIQEVTLTVVYKYTSDCGKSSETVNMGVGSHLVAAWDLIIGKFAAASVKVEQLV